MSSSAMNKFKDFVNNGGYDEAIRRREEKAEEQRAAREVQRRNAERASNTAPVSSANNVTGRNPNASGSFDVGSAIRQSYSPARVPDARHTDAMARAQAEREASEPQTAQRHAEEQGLELIDWDYNEVNRDVLYRTDTAPNPSADTIVATPDNLSQGETPEYRWQDNLNYVDPLTEWELSLTPQERRAYQNERLAEQRQEEMTEFAEEHPYIGTAAQIAMIPGDLVMTSVGGLYEASKKGTVDYFSNLLLEPVGMMTEATNKAFVNMGNETGSDSFRYVGQAVDSVRQEVENYNGIDPNNPLFVLGDIRQGLQQGTMNVVDVNVDGTDVFDFAYGAATSAAESIAAAVIPGGAVFLSTKAGTEAMRSAKEKGLSDNDAVMMGVFTGVIEAITERIPLENIRAFSTANTLTVKGIIKNVLKQSAAEGTEELISETANIIYDTLVHGDLSDYNLAVERYQNQGYSFEEAKKKAREDLVMRIVESFAQGALAGGMTGAGASTVGYVSNRGTQKQYGAALRENGDINEYVQTGLSAPKNTEAYQIARNITDKSGDAELGALVLAVEDYEAQVASQNNNRFSEYNTVEALDEAYEIAKVKINPKAKGTIKNLDRDYKAAKNRIKTAERTGRSAVQSTTVRNAQQTRGTAENAQPTQSTQPAEVKPLTPEQKVQTTNPTVGRTAEGKVVSVSDITDIKNGQIFVKTSDGKTQALKYADIGNAQARKVWEMAAKSFTDPKAAKAFIDNYNGETVSDYANAFNDYYQLASAGMSLEQINELGVAKGNISLAAKVAAVDAGAMSISYRKGVVDQTTTKKTKMQSLQIQMLDSFGKKYGLNITFVNTLGDLNGIYKPGTNQIVVGLDASEGAVTRTVGHEVYHYIKDANKEGAQKIEDFVLKSLKKLKGEEWVQNKLDSYDKSVYKTEQERIDELVADCMFDVFTNEKTVQEFVKQDRGLAQRVLDRVKTLIADIRNIYNKLIARGSDEIAALRNELETLEKIRDLFFEALDETAPAVNQKQKNTAEAVKKSTKRTFSYDELISKPDMKLTVLAESVPQDINGKIDRGGLVDKALQNALKTGHINNNGNAEVYVKDIGRDVAISKAAVRHGIDRRIEVQAPVLMHIGEVISNSIEINQLMPKKATASDSYILLGAAKDSDNIYVVSSIVNRYTNSIDSVDVLYSANIKKESAVSKTRASGNALQSLTDSTISISNLLDVVKDKSPEILSNDVLKHYGLTRGKGEIESALKFSTKSKPTNPIREEVSDYIGSSAHVQSIVKTIDKRYRLAGKKKLNEKSIERFAKDILAQTKSKYNEEQLVERLTALFEFMANSRDFSWDDIMQITAEIVKDVLSQSSKLDTSMRDEFSDTLKWLKGIDKVYISPEVRAEIDATFGSLDNFRRQIGSRMKITVTDSNAISLDSVWSQLAGDYPGVFDSEITPLDQPAALADFFEMTKPTYKNPYEMNMDEAAYDYTLRIYDQYFDIPEVKTEAQKHQIAMQRAREDFNKRLDVMRKEYKAREQEIVREAKLQADNRIAREQLLNKRRQEAYREKRRDIETRQSYRSTIIRASKGMIDKLVRPSDAKHIPHDLIPVVSDFCRTIVEGGIFSYEKTTQLLEKLKPIDEFTTDLLVSDDVAAELAYMRDIVKGKRLSELTVSELKLVKEITLGLRHMVVEGNKMFAEERNESLSAVGYTIYEEFKDQKTGKKRIQNEMQIGLLKPDVFFELLESPELVRATHNLENAQYAWVQKHDNIKDFFAEQIKECNYEKWWKKTIEVEISGRSIPFTADEALSIYAMSKRPDALRHLLGDGFIKEKEGLNRFKEWKKNHKKEFDKKQKESPKAFLQSLLSISKRMTEADIRNIVDKLREVTDGKAIQYADAVIKYLSNDMAKMGNEATMKVYGREKFKEEFYFPIISDPNYIHFEAAKGIDQRLSSKSFSKSTVDYARNAVVVGSFTEIAVKHCEDMATYATMLAPLYDFTRIYNYKSVDKRTKEPFAIRSQIQRVYGNKANQYIEQFLKDLNGGVVQGAGAGTINSIVGKVKRDAVSASLQVAIQQPSAYLRATSEVSWKHFVAPHMSAFSSRKWKELKKYAPVARIKEIGGYDTNLGHTAMEDVLGKYSYRDKFVLTKVRDNFNDFLGRLPAYMDRITWVAIWKAVKNETKSKHPDMKVNSEEFLQKAGERFTYVVNQTQVYDSVFSRSHWLRSRDSGVKQLLSFKNEQVIAFNMIYKAAALPQERIAKKGKILAKTFVAVISSVVFNSLLEGLTGAERDEDKEKSFAEKYVSKVVNNVLTGIIGIVPFLDEFVSVIQSGFESSEMTDEYINRIADVIMKVLDEDKTPEEKLKAIASVVGLITGIPLRNIWKEIEGVRNIYREIIEKEPTTKMGLIYAIQDEIDFKALPFLDVPTTAEQYVEAYFLGDEEHMEKTYNNLMEKYADEDMEQHEIEDKVRSAIKEAITNGYKEGQYTQDQVMEFYVDIIVPSYGDDKKRADDDMVKALKDYDPRVLEAAQAEINGDSETRIRLTKEIIADGFDQNLVVKAVNSTINKLSEEPEEEYELKEQSLYSEEDYFDAASRGNESEANTYKEELIRVDMENNEKTREEAEKSFNENFRSMVKKAVIAGDVTVAEAAEMLEDFGGLDKETAQMNAQYYDFIGDYPDLEYNWKAETVAAYYESAKPSGIRVSVYDDYLVRKSECEGTDNNNDGKADNGSKKAQILDVIDSLPISSRQKDVLYRMNGWAESKLYEAPWH